MKLFHLQRISLFLTLCICSLNLNAQNLTAKQLGDKAWSFSQQFQSDSALHYNQLASDQYLAEGDTIFHYRFRINVAFELLRQNRLDEALEVSQLALSEGQDLMDDLHLAIAHRMNAQVFNLKKETDEALSHYQKALDILKEDNSESAIRLKATISSDKGILYYYKGDYAKAEDYWKNALNVVSQVEPGELGQLFCEFSLNLSAVLLIRGAKNESIEVLEKAAYMANNYLNNPENMLAFIYGNLGSAYDQENSEKKAIEYYTKSVNVLDKLNNEPNKAMSLYSLSSAYLNTGQFKKALDLLSEGIAISENIMGKTHENTLIGYNTLADYYKKTGDYKLAEELLYRVLDIEKNQAEKPTSRSAMAYYLLAEIKEIDSDIPAAIFFCKKALGVGLTEGDESSYISNYGNLLGGLFFKNDQIDSALYHFQNSLKSLTNPDLDIDPLINPQRVIYSNYYQASNILINKARALERKFDMTGQSKYIEAAVTTASQANAIALQIKQQSNIIQDKFLAQSTLSSLNNIGFRLACKRHRLNGQSEDLNQAFMYMQANKSTLILNRLQENIALETLGLPLGLIKEHDDVQASISYYEEELFYARQEEDSVVQVRKYNDLLFTLRIRQDSLQKEMERDYPKFFKAKFKNDFVNLQDIQKQLTKDQLMLNYHVGDSSLYIFEISQNHVNLTSKPLNSVESEDVSQLLKFLESPESSPSSLQEFVKIASGIKSALVPNQKTLDGFDHLIIVPDNFISVVPFEILVSDTTGITSFKNLDYMIRSRSISYANSSSLFKLQSSLTNRSPGVNILAFAPSFNQTEVQTVILPDSSRNNLTPLVWTEREIKSIATHFETDLLLGKEATERKLRASGKDYSIIHLASHGLLNEQAPLYSKLVFSPFDTDSINDGYLNTQELYAMKIPAEMVVLSACNSGLGDVVSGEGIISLANGFFYAGSKSLVMSLWTANDQSTATIIDSFYDELSQGKQKSDALRNAKLKFLAEADGLRSHPYYWAHLVVNGNNSPIVKNNSYWIYLIIAMAFLFLMTVRRRVKQRQLV